MKTIERTKRILLAVCAVATMLISISSCKDGMDGKTFLTSDEIMIDEYIEKEDPTMSTFLNIVDKVGFRGMIHAYGTYTCFIPTNDAIDEYAKSKGVASWSDLPESALTDLVKFHIVNDTLRTSDFIDGRLSAATLSDKYLTTRTEEIGGTTSIRVNRQGLITKKDIQCANGYIQRIDQVLIPNELTVGDEIRNLPATYSIFKEVMEETGWTAALSKAETAVWYTVFLQDNEAYAKAGIKSKEDLLARLAKDRYDLATDKERLLSYAAYQCVKGLYYVADLSYLSALQPEAMNQAITLKLSKDTLLVNEYNNPVAGIREAGVPVDKESTYTDYTCANGVTIDMTGYIGPMKRSAVAVYWEVTEQPEIIKMKEFRKSRVEIPLTTFSEITFDIRTSSYTTLFYEVRSGFRSDYQQTHNDSFELNWNRITSISFKTPLLIEGTYNVWVCWRRAGSGDKVRGIFKQDGKDDQEMPNIIDFSEYFLPSNTNAQALLASGMKRYTAKQRNSTMNSRLLGTIVVESTGRHTLMLASTNQAKNAAMWLDMIQFIPVDDDQLWPRFDMDGNAVYPGTDCETIAPTDQPCSADNDDY